MAQGQGSKRKAKPKSPPLRVSYVFWGLGEALVDFGVLFFSFCTEINMLGSAYRSWALKRWLLYP